MVRKVVRTTNETVGELMLFVRDHAGSLQGKSLKEIEDKFRDETKHDGSVSPAVLRRVLARCKVQWKVAKSKYPSRRDRSCVLASLFIKYAEGVDRTLQALDLGLQPTLTPELRSAIEALGSGSRMPRLPLFEKLPSSNGQANGHANGHAVASN